MTYDHPNNNAVIFKNEKMKKRCRSCCNVCLLLLGIALIGLGLAIFAYFEPLYDYMMTSAMTFTPKTEPFKVWRKNDPPLDMDIYLFNWTNPQDLHIPGVKPKFQEIGPYRFKEVKEKINITWHDNNNTISYRHKKTYFFDAKNSVRQLDDVISTINVVPLAIAYKARHFGFFSKRTISYSLSSLSSLYVTKTAGEILFDGYKESILSILSTVPLAGVVDKFGLFYGKNNSMGSDGVFSMWTKVDEDFGKIVTWNYKNESEFYEGECNAVKGSAGEFYPINQKRDYIELFSSELCKFAKLEYEKDVNVKGVLGYKYTARHIFDNGTLRPENKCFCSGDCHPSGVFNVSKCRENSPTFLSMPHFYGADPYYYNAIEGLKPEDKHEFYITLEPKSGIVVDIGARMQVNVLLQPIEHITMYADVPKLFIPLFYFDQSIPATDELASLLIQIQNLPEVSNIAVLILVTLGLASFVWVVVMYCWSKKRKHKTELKIPQNSVTVEEIPLRC
ncbi:protein peste-like isoform X1 [Tribolium madens]|uniref:protein peste-like isoform X1 n=2 Tax=Tribolium madens TaxID=41895 RepID=UPI001CF72473|nr:protein peste-like isoform X1 [Tribolium madens]